MGVDTKVKFIGKLDVKKLFEFIKNEIDANAVNNITQEKRFLDSKYHKNIIFMGEIEGYETTTSGFIRLEYNGESRSLHYFHEDTLWMDKNVFEENIKNGTPEFNGETTTLSLGYNENAIAIMKKIAEHFGGYIDEYDCDSEWFYKVEKASK